MTPFMETTLEVDVDLLVGARDDGRPFTVRLWLDDRTVDVPLASYVDRVRAAAAQVRARDLTNLLRDLAQTFTGVTAVQIVERGSGVRRGVMIYTVPFDEGVT